MPLPHRATLASLLLLGTACSFDLSVPADAKISCRSSNDCPAQLSCIVSLGRCAPADQPCTESVAGELRVVPDGNACTGATARSICLGGECVASVCGDGVIDAVLNEVCDDGLGNSDSQVDACRAATCMPASCGDGVVDTGEQCDDGNLNDYDGCTQCSVNLCGDGVLNPDLEECDDGNFDNEDDCLADCHANVCGDGYWNALSEGCDDGNLNPNDGCDVTAGCVETAWHATLVVGAGASGNNPDETNLGRPQSVVVDGTGNVFVLDYYNPRIWRYDLASGSLTPVAGSGERAFKGDGGPARGAAFFNPAGMAIDFAGNLYVADTVNNRIRRVDASTNVITTVAGSGPGADVNARAYAGDGGFALAARLAWPQDVAVDNQGNLFIADTSNSRVRRVDAVTQQITTVAGNGTTSTSGDALAAVAAGLPYPRCVDVDGEGNLYIAADNRVRRVDAVTQTIDTVAGLGAGHGGDGGPALAAGFAALECLSVADNGDIYVTDSRSHRVRLIDGASQVITTVAGSGPVQFAGAYAGDGGDPLSARFDQPRGVALDYYGGLWIADQNNGRLRSVDRQRLAVQTVLSGAGPSAWHDGTSPTSQGAPTWFRALCVESDQSLLAATLGDAYLGRIHLDQRYIEVVAGNGTSGIAGDGGPATAAAINGNVVAIAKSSTGTIYFLSPYDTRLRAVLPDGSIASLGPAELLQPYDLALDLDGNLLVADAGNHRVVKFDIASASYSLIAGTGSPGFNGESNTDPTLLTLTDPRGLAVAPNGDILIADSGNHRVRLLARAAGTIGTVLGDTSSSDPYASGCWDIWADGQLMWPHDVAFGPSGEILIADTCHARVLSVASGGGVTVLAGGDSALGQREFVSATSTWIGEVTRLAVAGNTLFFDGEFALRRMDLDDRILTTVAGTLDGVPGTWPDPEMDGKFERAVLTTPHGLALASDGSWAVVADGLSRRVRRMDFARGLLQTAVGCERCDGSAVARYSRLLGTPTGIALVEPAAADPFFIVSESTSHALQRIDVADPSDETTWSVSTWAGTVDLPGHADGDRGSALFDGPTGLAYSADDVAGGEALYVADSGNQVIRRIDLATGQVSTVAGRVDGRGYYGENVLATDALFNSPEAVALGPNSEHPQGSLYIADTGNGRVRRLDFTTGLIATVLNDGDSRSRALLVDNFGNLFVAGESRIRVLNPVAGEQVKSDAVATTIYEAGSTDAFASALTTCIAGMALKGDDASAGTVLFTDRCHGFVIELARAAR